jgi:hypothetical protein
VITQCHSNAQKMMESKDDDDEDDDDDDRELTQNSKG